MKIFNELIKNFDRIRKYLRVFTIYGYKYRDDFVYKSNRTYDNEKRRIKSYLNKYMNERTSLKGKSISINFDYLTIESNPLFEVFKTKSFTKNDIMFHFIISDVLKTYSKLTLNQIYEVLFLEYLNKFKECRNIDQRTLRIKLNEYVAVGLINEEKKGKIIYYYSKDNILNCLSPKTSKNLFNAILFYQNIYPLGVVGHFILEKYQKENSIFVFANYYFSHIIDEMILFDLMKALKLHKDVKLYYKNKRENIVLPIKFVDNVELGRRYIVVYSYRQRKYIIYRLDKIEKIDILNQSNANFEQKLKIVDTMLEKTWSIAFHNIENSFVLESWDLVLKIDEIHEKYLLDEIENSHSEAILQKVGMNTFRYIITIIDANESVPWIRQLMGRILSVECSNEEALKRFLSDIEIMKNYYMEDSNDNI